MGQAENGNAIEHVERWAIAAANSLCVPELEPEEQRGWVGACLAQVEGWGAHLPLSEQGAVRALSRALSRATCKRLGGSLAEETGLDTCVYWTGRALDWADEHVRLRSEGARFDALLKVGACFERAETARVLVGRQSVLEARLALRLIQAARELVKDIVIGARAGKAAA